MRVVEADRSVADDEHERGDSFAQPRVFNNAAHDVRHFTDREARERSDGRPHLCAIELQSRAGRGRRLLPDAMPSGREPRKQHPQHKRHQREPSERRHQQRAPHRQPAAEMDVVAEKTGSAALQPARAGRKAAGFEIDFGDIVRRMDGHRAERPRVRVRDALVVHRDVEEPGRTERLAGRLHLFQVTPKRLLALVEAEDGLKRRRIGTTLRRVADEGVVQPVTDRYARRPHEGSGAAGHRRAHRARPRSPRRDHRSSAPRSRRPGLEAARRETAATRARPLSAPAKARLDRTATTEVPEAGRQTTLPAPHGRGPRARTAGGRQGTPAASRSGRVRARGRAVPRSAARCPPSPGAPAVPPSGNQRGPRPPRRAVRESSPWTPMRSDWPCGRRRRVAEGSEPSGHIAPRERFRTAPESIRECRGCARASASAPIPDRDSRRGTGSAAGESRRRHRSRTPRATRPDGGPAAPQPPAAQGSNGKSQRRRRPKGAGPPAPLRPRAHQGRRTPPRPTARRQGDPCETVTAPSFPPGSTRVRARRPPGCRAGRSRARDRAGIRDPGRRSLPWRRGDRGARRRRRRRECGRRRAWRDSGNRAGRARSRAARPRARPPPRTAGARTRAACCGG